MVKPTHISGKGSKKLKNEHNDLNNLPEEFYLGFLKFCTEVAQIDVENGPK